MKGSSGPVIIVLFSVTCMLLFSGISEACIALNEVNPEGVEWIELYNQCNATIDMAEWFISDNSTAAADTITCHDIQNCSLETDAGYFLIIGRNINITDVTHETVTYFFVDDQSIGNGLKDNGFEEVRFYNETYTSYMNYTGSSGSSWSLCNGTWTQRNATPGRENECHVEEQPQPPAVNVTDVSITSWSMNATSATEGDTIIITVNAWNAGNASESASLHINASGFPEFACGDFDISPLQETSLSCIWRVPDADEDVASIFVMPRLSGDGWSASGSAISVSITRECEMNVSISAEPIETSTRFGDKTFVRVTVCKECVRAPLRIAAYLYSPHWASVDAGGEVIRTRPNETSSAIVIEEAADGCRTFYVPVLIIQDCEKDFGEGLYSGKARVYEDVTGKVLKEQNFNMTLSGRNHAACVECDECKKCDCNCQKSSCSSGSSAAVTGVNAAASVTPAKKSFRYFDVEAVPQAVSAGESFSVNVTIKNTLSSVKDFTAYSYAYNGSACVSLGQAPAGWMKGWDANRKTATVDSGGRERLELRNLIPEDVAPGIYSFRIRLRYGDGDEKEDATFSLEVTQPQQAVKASATIAAESVDSAQKESGTANETPASKGIKSGSAPITGMSAAKKEGDVNFLSSFYETLLSIVSLFKF